METRHYTEDIAHIRSMMERSSRFISLSGWAGILPGIFALAGLAAVIWFISESKHYEWYADGIDRNSPLALQLASTGLVVLVLSVFSSWYMCMRKARRENQSTWTPAIRNMLVHFSIPLIAGAIITGWLYEKEQWGMMPPVLLAFYGLALIQASHYTLRSVFWLGIFEIILAFPGGIPGWGIPVLAVGFGFAHIIYGILQLPRNPLKVT